VADISDIIFSGCFEDKLRRRRAHKSFQKSHFRSLLPRHIYISNRTRCKNNRNLEKNRNMGILRLSAAVAALLVVLLFNTLNVLSLDEGSSARDVLLNNLAAAAARGTGQQQAVDNGAGLLGITAALRNRLTEKGSTSVETIADCCSAAFSLCVQPPDVSNKTFENEHKKLLKIAQKDCADITVVKLKTEAEICEFYNPPAACAISPQSEAGIKFYNDKRSKCCNEATPYCKSPSKMGLYHSRKLCLGFAVRTESEICNFVSNECNGEGLGQ